MKLQTFSRILVGLVFIFSGFVKGVDPLGTVYRIEDYFFAYGTDWAVPFALFLSIALSTLEFLLGIALLLNLKLKTLSWILFPLMIFFTLLTFYDALYEPVPDCGCFGDAIKLSNWQTFYKNIVLIVFVFIVFKCRKMYISAFNRKSQLFILIVFAFSFAAFSYYQYQHLPMIDFREWKIGNEMKSVGEAREDTYLTYRNKESGEEKEYLSPNFPWNDSVWMSKWEFVDQRKVISGSEAKHNLFILDSDGYDITKSIIENPAYQFIVVSWDMSFITKDQGEKINQIFNFCDQHGIAFVGLTGTREIEIPVRLSEHAFDFVFYNTDDIALKSVVRSNPGLILLKNGVVLNKWHYNDFPEAEELKNLLHLD